MSVAWAARNWDEVPCEILFSRFDEESRIRDARTQVFSKVVVQYRYSYDGKEFVGDRYDFSVGESTGNYGERYMAAQQLKAGNTDVCYVNPENPSEAVFRRSTGLSRDDKLLAWVPVAFVAVGLLGLVGVAVAFCVPKKKSEVMQAIEAAFPRQEWKEARAVVLEYGTEEHEREIKRVRLAVIKLSDGNLDSLRDAVKEAKADYRDVLMWSDG